MLQSHFHIISSNFPFSIRHRPPNPNPSQFHFPVYFKCNPSSSRRRTHQWLTQTLETTYPLAREEGPIELPLYTPSIFATTDDPSPIQVATSVLLTCSISIFLFRALRRRAKRVKDLRYRSSGAKKNLMEETLDSLNAMGPSSIGAESPPSPLQAMLGGLTAGVIALILYKFTTTIEAALNRQTISDSFSVRQITVTIRTIINGLCYLATYVFGFNALGLLLYSGQLAVNSLTEYFPSKQIGSECKEQLSSSNATGKSTTESSKLDDNNGDKISNNIQL